jgi:hypothetical protein
MRTALRLAIAGLTVAVLVLGVIVISSQPTGTADRKAAGPTSVPSTVPSAAAVAKVPRPDHVVVVILENKNRASLIGNGSAPNLDALATSGASMTQSYGVTHPSQPNYLALFSGSTHGVKDNSCPRDLGDVDNLGAQLAAAGMSFTGYSESMPTAGYTGCHVGQYQRKHNSWVDFSNVPASANQPFSAFPSDYRKLPTVAFVAPNMCNSMHDCSIRTGDTWVKDHLAHYADWALTHNSLLVVTFDENAGGTVNQIPTLLIGQSVKPGTYAEQMNHYTLLRTIEDAYGLPPLGNAAHASPLKSIWSAQPPASTAPGIVNGSFESGLAGWARSGTTAAVKSRRHGGSLVGRAGSRSATTGDSIISQTITIPRGRSKLRVGWLGRCKDTRSRAWATIRLKKSSGSKITVLPKTCHRTGGWHAVSTRVTAGKVYTVQLINHDDGKKSTPNRTYFDDVTVS